LAVVTIKDLLESGVHFGHQTRRWNPKMKRFIYEERNGIYIIDLQKTMAQLKKACGFLRTTVSKGGEVLFVGTKKQAKQALLEASAHCRMHSVTERWLGGTLTNNATIRRSINRLQELESMVEEGTMDLLGKKEVSMLMREKNRLHKNLDGIKNMKRLPEAVFVVDPKRENIAVAEARKLSIPVIAVLDTNCDPDMVDYAIPGNDDAIKSVALIASILASVINEVAEQYRSQVAEKPEAGGKEKAKPKSVTAKSARVPKARKPKATTKKKVVVTRKETAKSETGDDKQAAEAAAEEEVPDDTKAQANDSEQQAVPETIAEAEAIKKEVTQFEEKE